MSSPLQASTLGARAESRPGPSVRRARAMEATNNPSSMTEPHSVDHAMMKTMKKTDDSSDCVEIRAQLEVCGALARGDLLSPLSRSISWHVGCTLASQSGAERPQKGACLRHTAHSTTITNHSHISLESGMGKMRCRRPFASNSTCKASLNLGKKLGKIGDDVLGTLRVAHLALRKFLLQG